MHRLPILLLLTLVPGAALAQQAEGDVHLTRFADGGGPAAEDGTFRLLDGSRTPGQSNAVAFDRAQGGAFEKVTLRCKLRVLEGGDGGAFLFLNTAEYGARGAAPFVASWVEPNLRKSFAVGIDVHNPRNEEMFGPWGNYQGLPEREVSLHWDGREVVKRLAPEEFRGDFADCEITLAHVIGGAEVTVRLGEGVVYDRYFLPGCTPYEMRLAFGAGTRADASTEFDVKDVSYVGETPAAKVRPPLRFQVFNHVLTDNSKTAFENEVDLPPLDFDLGRVILHLDIHDAGVDWDEWDRNGEVSIIGQDGVPRGIVPFITSYRTPCHWEVDVTHFRPWLAGKTRFEVRAGTTFYKNRGYMMSVALEFHHGRAELEAYRVVPLWHGVARYGSAENHFADFFTPQTVEIDETARAARIFLTTTGHSQVGEFVPSKRTVTFVPDRGAADAPGVEFPNVLWKSDCYLNPNRPQFGTWKFSRAGWAPGDVVWPWWIDVTPHLQRGKAAEIRYDPQPYEFEEGEAPEEKKVDAASHVVRAYLILMRPPGDTVPAPSLRVTGIGSGGHAAAAGVQAGDYLVSYDGRPLESVDGLRAAIAQAEAAGKEAVQVVLYRGSERMEVSMPPGRLGVNLSGP